MGKLLKLREKISNIIFKTKYKIEITEEKIIKFTKEHADLIVGLMSFMDKFYDTYIGDKKMEKVIEIVICAINNKFEANISINSADKILDAIKTALQEIYEKFYKAAQNLDN